MRETISRVATASPFGAALEVALGMNHARSLATLAAGLGCTKQAIAKHVPALRAALGPLAARQSASAYAPRRGLSVDASRIGRVPTASPTAPQHLPIFATTREAAAALGVTSQALLAALHEDRAPFRPVAMLGRAYAWDKQEVARVEALILAPSLT